MSRHSLNCQFFFSSNVFCTWRRAVRLVRSMICAQSRAFTMRPMLLQWHGVAVQGRVDRLPTRAMHFSDLLRAQSISREILLQPSTLLALRTQSRDEAAQKHMYWSQPMQSEESILASLPSQGHFPKTHVILATASPSSPALEKLSLKVSRIISPARPAWVPTSVAGGAVESKRRTGPR